MREILFRGKTEQHKWAYGYLVANAKWYVTGRPMTVLIPGDCVLYPPYEIESYEEVIPETVGQFTGVTDKNGKKIFEGDIIKHYTHVLVGKPEKFEVGLIRWNEKYLAWERTTPDKSEPLIGCVRISHTSVYEVIGNIHDNPELLENEQ